MSSGYLERRDMDTIINDGICLKCHCPSTSIIDGKPSPFCPACEQFLNEKIAAGKLGEKFKKGKLTYESKEEQS